MANSLQAQIRVFLEKVNLFTKVKNWKRKKQAKRWGPDLSSWLTSASFAAMDVSSQLKQVFKFFDANGDGKISPLELSSVLLSLGHDKSMATMEAEGIVREVDFNGDGFIDLDEFMSVMDIDTSKSVNAISKEEDEDGCGDGDLKHAFMIFDTDKNGLISAKELQKVLISLGWSNSSLRECRKMIKGVDKDGDGFVDFEEFKSMMTAGI